MRVAVIVPTLDEEAALPSLLAAVRDADEVIVADGGSRDTTPRIAREHDARVISAPRGRGHQLAAGAAVATADLLWFLHADATVPPGALPALRGSRSPWGCFAVHIASPDPRLRLTAAAMNARARLTGSCTGDMGIWARRAFHDAIGGWPALAAFEDLAFSDAARARAPAEVLTPALGTSPRRWERHGVTRTTARMWALRLAYRLGTPPERLAAYYATAPR